MKRSISILSALAFVFVFSGSVFAQSGSDNVTASVDIVTDISVTQNEDLSFGQISNSQSTDAIIDPNGTNSNVGNTTTLGKVSISAAAGSSISVSFTGPSSNQLSDGGSSTIGFTGNYTGSETDNAAGSTDLNAGSANDITLTGSTYYVFLGGTLNGTDISNATPGNHTGTISVNVDYQ